MCGKILKCQKNMLYVVEVKANDNSTISLNYLIDSNKHKDIKYGFKLCNKNIGFNGKFYTFFHGFPIKKIFKRN